MNKFKLQALKSLRDGRKSRTELLKMVQSKIIESFIYDPNGHNPSKSVSHEQIRYYELTSAGQ